MHLRSFRLLVCLLLVVPVLAPALLVAQPPGLLSASKVEDPHLQALEWREVGPYRGGRSAAVDGVEGQRDVYYFGATGGGVWKTTDAGRTWVNVSDGFFGGSIGAVAVSPNGIPTSIYVGGGEKTVRGNVSHGNGVSGNPSTAGKTWTHMGLADTRHIPRIRIHPKNPDRLWVAALGHLYGPNEERGVFRSDDGGKTWEKVLYGGPDAGAVDLILDPTNPRILYASLWRVRRTPWTLESGGEGSGLWKSTDGGDTWKEISTNKGFPKAPLGIIGIAVSPTDPENLYAMVEAEEGGVYRSRDGGETWTRTNEERSLRQRAWYYTRIYADPGDAESVYVLNVRFHHSKDGGRTFRQIPTPHGDNHDLWINPDQTPQRMVQANDGGANVSVDGARILVIDPGQPAHRRVLPGHGGRPVPVPGPTAAQQDNTADQRAAPASPPGRSHPHSALARRWPAGRAVTSPWTPRDPGLTYAEELHTGSFLDRYQHAADLQRNVINVWPEDPMGDGVPPSELRYRFQWNFAHRSSRPHDPDARLRTPATSTSIATRDGGA